MKNKLAELQLKMIKNGKLFMFLGGLHVHMKFLIFHFSTLNYFNVVSYCELMSLKY